MEDWTPASADDVASIVARELSQCPKALIELFNSIGVPPRSVSILRSGVTESVFVVAERNGTVIYYEDVEEGFNISPLAEDGSIATPGYHQWGICHALRQFEA